MLEWTDTCAVDSVREVELADLIVEFKPLGVRARPLKPFWGFNGSLRRSSICTAP